MDDLTLLNYWDGLPIGRENAATYTQLCARWKKDERTVRSILHELSSFDNGDDYILIRSGKGKGFYKTDDAEEIKAFKAECLKKGRSVFAPVKKINRILSTNTRQYVFGNNLRVIRERCGMKQGEVCAAMQLVDPHFDKPMLSRMENSVCFPTPLQLATLSMIYRCDPNELLDTDIYF